MIRRSLLLLSVFLFFSCRRESNINIAKRTLTEFMNARVKNDTTLVLKLVYPKNTPNMEPEDPDLPVKVAPKILGWKLLGVQPASRKKDVFLFTIQVSLQYGGKYNISGNYDELIAIKKTKSDHFKIVDIQTGPFHQINRKGKGSVN